MLGDINQLRTRHRLSSLTLDPRLCRAAKQNAEEMAQYNYFSHRGRRRFVFANGPGSRATAHGYQWKAIAENMCAAYRKAPAAFQKLGIADLPRFTRWNRYQAKTKASRKGRGGRSGKENDIFLASSFCSSD
jgi:Cysteine-rich secretory protein family